MFHDGAAGRTNGRSWQEESARIVKSKTSFTNILIALILGVSLSLVTQGRADDFHVGYFLVKPHAMPGSNNKPEGVAVKYFDRIAGKMELSEVRFSLFPLKRLLIALEHNKIDMALLLAKNDERSAKLVYPADPFCLSQPCIVVKSSHPLRSVQSVEELLPFTINESAGAFRSPFIRDPRLKIEPLYGSEFTSRCFTKLASGRIDACYQPDHYPLQFEANKAMHKARMRILALPEPAVGLYSVFSKKSSKRYLTDYEMALRQVKQEILYEELFRTLVDKHAVQ